MSLIFANPLGFLALLGVPVLLAIYFFQRQSKEFLAPTMFLLKNQLEHRSGGRQFKRFQSSWSLFLQLLALLLLSFLLAQPRVKNTEVTQKIALVIDASASMSAFKPELEQAVQSAFSELSKENSAYAIQVFSSLPEAPALYTGGEPTAALESLKKWSPLSGMIDPTAVLNLARSRVGSSGLLLYLTDHVTEYALPAQAKLLSVGSPINNVGFCGVSVKQKEGQDLAHVLVKNYGRFMEERSYQIQTATGEVILTKELSLAPGKVKTLSFPFSPERYALCFILEPDAFSLDDTAPLIIPQKKALTLSTPQQKDPKVTELGKKLASALGAPDPEKASSPDIIIQSQLPVNLSLPATHSINFIQVPAEKKLSALTAPLIPKVSALTQDLIWDTLILPDTPSFIPSARDEVILWAGEKPLISIRSTSVGEKSCQHLLCNFSLRNSNVDTQANLAVLLFRYAEQIRENKTSFFTDLAEVNQPINYLTTPSPLTEETPLSMNSALHYAPTYKRTVSTPSELRTLTLPATPNIINFTQGDKEVAVLSSHFADTREADFSKAAASERSPLLSAAERIKTTKPLPYRYFYLLLLLFLVLGIWFLDKNRP